MTNGIYEAIIYHMSLHQEMKLKLNYFILTYQFVQQVDTNYSTFFAKWPNKQFASVKYFMK